MKKVAILSMMTLLIGQSVLASHSIPIVGCNQGKIISSDNGELHCLSQEVPCTGRTVQLSAYDEGGPGLACVKTCQYVDHAEGGEGLTCLGQEGN